MRHLGLTGDYKGLLKLRVGDSRVIYQLLRSEHRIVVHVIGHRSTVYD